MLAFLKDRCTSLNTWGLTRWNVFGTLITLITNDHSRLPFFTLLSLSILLSFHCLILLDRTFPKRFSNYENVSIWSFHFLNIIMHVLPPIFLYKIILTYHISITLFDSFEVILFVVLWFFYVGDFSIHLNKVYVYMHPFHWITMYSIFILSNLIIPTLHSILFK